jgi:hypothetical protein
VIRNYITLIKGALEGIVLARQIVYGDPTESLILYN